MTIADLIRIFLSSKPDGALTSQAALYCLENGAKFQTLENKKTVSGQLSKMRQRGEVGFHRAGRSYIWYLMR